MRYYLCKKNVYLQSKKLKKLINKEKKLKLDKISTFKYFANRVKKSKRDLVELLTKLKKKGKTISSYGATSKSTTIFNFCKINKNLIENYYDNTKIKQNKYSPGMHTCQEFFKNEKISRLFFYQHGIIKKKY